MCTMAVSTPAPLEYEASGYSWMEYISTTSFLRLAGPDHWDADLYKLEAKPQFNLRGPDARRVLVIGTRYLSRDTTATQVA